VAAGAAAVVLAADDGRDKPGKLKGCPDWAAEPKAFELPKGALLPIELLPKGALLPMELPPKGRLLKGVLPVIPKALLAAALLLVPMS